MTAVRRVAFLGPGAMGAPMARRLVEDGFNVVVWGRDPERVKRAVEPATVVARAADAVENADVVLSCLLDGPTAHDVYLGAHGVMAATRRGTVIVEHGTLSPAEVRQCAEAAAGRGCAFVDAPVSGGPEGARAGTLVAMAGGDPEVIARVTPVLLSYCGLVRRVGSSGSGAALKLVNQMLVISNLAAAAEACSALERAGVARATARELLVAGWADSVMLRRVLDRPRGEAEPSGSPLGHLDKVAQVVDAFVHAEESGAAAPVFAAAAQQVRTAVLGGHADRDLAALADVRPGQRPELHDGAS